MAQYFILLCAVFSSLFAICSGCQQTNHSQQLIDEMQESKLKVVRLESVLEETIRNMNAKTLYLKEREKVIQDMENQIQTLQSALSSSKGDLSSVDARISELEEEVKLLWAASRKNNFDLHGLEAKARDAEDRVQVFASKVEMISDIATEQWIQIQQLEQMREFNARRHLSPTRCTFLKFMNSLFEKHLAKFGEMFDVYSRGKKTSLNSYLPQALRQLKGFWAAITKYHHELQGLIKHEMERNEFTAALANREVVFFLASTLITFPVLGSWMLLSS